MIELNDSVRFNDDSSSEDSDIGCYFRAVTFSKAPSTAPTSRSKTVEEEEPDLSKYFPKACRLNGRKVEHENPASPPPSTAPNKRRVKDTTHPSWSDSDSDSDTGSNTSTPSSPQSSHPGTTTHYLLILACIQKLHALYTSRGEDPHKYAKNELPVQGPIPKYRGRKVVLYCRCKKRIPKPNVPKECIRCYDPGCDVPDGWYHERCLEEEEMVNRGPYAEWICNTCLERRLEEGVPELESESLKKDRYLKLIRLVVKCNKEGYRDREGSSEGGADGLSVYEKAQSGTIDERLKATGKWPPFNVRDVRQP